MQRRSDILSRFTMVFSLSLAVSLSFFLGLYVSNSYILFLSKGALSFWVFYICALSCARAGTEVLLLLLLRVVAILHSF